MRCYGLLVLLISYSLTLQAQNEKVVHDNSQFWWSINTTARMADRWGVIGDFHIRRADFVSSSNFYFARIGAAYWATDKLTLVGGYAHLWLNRDLENNVTAYQDENRVYQQAQWRTKEGRVTFVSRVRNEQRWHEVLNPDGSVNRIRFSNRVRFLFSVNIPVFASPYLPTISIADEMLIHFGKEIVYNSFDQNRIFLGVKQKLTGNLSFDLGYMMVYQQRFSGYEYDMNHTLRFFFYYSPDFRKNKGGVHYSIPGDE
ncbi:MAG: DUF2490 domain-containing protein [Cyclobacteriaceae bacterium]